MNYELHKTLFWQVACLNPDQRQAPTPANLEKADKLVARLQEIENERVGLFAELRTSPPSKWPN